MRILIWILLLLGLAFAAARYHDRFMSDAREERDARQRDFRAEEGLPDGYGHAIVGGASGAEPVGPPVSAQPAPSPALRTEPVRPPPASEGTGAAGVEHVVKAGESLSKICAAHYGSGRADVVAAVVKFNHLASGDSIREGQKLQLPPLAKLGLPAR